MLTVVYLLYYLLSLDYANMLLILLTKLLKKANTTPAYKRCQQKKYFFYFFYFFKNKYKYINYLLSRFFHNESELSWLLQYNYLKTCVLTERIT